MQRAVRAFPVKSKQAVLNFAKGVDEWPQSEKTVFFDNFVGAIETWYFQIIEGKPYVIAVVEGDDLEEGFKRYASLIETDPFASWFREQVKELTGFDLTETPKGPETELLYELHA
ncbi:MAG: hypothetical protein AB4426_35090 [Xenococcaceae cyanobacterium]